MKPSRDYRKGIRRAQQLVNKARTWRRRYGMKENLGYEKERELRDYLNKLNLTYQEDCEIRENFNSLCDELNREN